MPLLFKRGKSNKSNLGEKGRRQLTGNDPLTHNWEEQRSIEHPAESVAPAKNAKQEQIKIEPRPFDGIKDIKSINPNDYFYLSHYIRKFVNPSKDVENAVLNFMVNMFLNLPDNFYEPGKSYSHREREFTREQLNVFRDSLSALEILCSEYNNFKGSIGNFSNKQTYKLENLDGLLHTGIWDGKGSYHIIYVSHPSNIAPTEFDESLLKHFIKCKEKIPDEKAIITRIANNLNEKGVLILEGGEIKEIPGLRIIDSYNKNVSLYQKL